MSHFDGDKPVTFTQGRRGEVIVTQGYGKRPQVYRSSTGAFRDAGLDAPTIAPQIAIDESDSAYVARLDITNAGSGYIRPPLVQIDPPAGVTSRSLAGPVRGVGKTATTGPRQATAVTRIREGRLDEVEVTDHGRLYTTTPNVKLLDNSGAGGAVISITLDGTPATETGIVVWQKQYNGTGFLCDPPAGGYWMATGGSGSGAGIMVGKRATNSPGSSLPDCQPAQGGSNIDVSKDVPGADVIRGLSGSGYASTDEVTVSVTTSSTLRLWGNSVIIQDCGKGCPVVFKGYPVGHPSVGTKEEVALKGKTSGLAVKAVTVSNGGSGYSANTVVRILPYSGAPSWMAEVVKATVVDGRITAVETPKSKYTFQPVVEIGEADQAASVIAIMRPTFRGKYQCYYRYRDDSVPEAEGGPLYTSLSPVTEVDAGDSSSSLTWTLPAKPGFPPNLVVELWRSSSNQATTLYRVAELTTETTYLDKWNDSELTDPDRDGFTAMPILLPNGELNANRFGVPPSDYAVAVMFQDRLWMGVDTTGTRPNYLRFSEMDEPESMPDVNEIIVQQNLRSGDYITALIPYAGALVVCQSRHSHRLTYVSQPLVDVGVFMLAYRGCLNQRCWDIYEGRAYILDEQGVYSLDPQGQVEGLTIGLDDIFQEKVDWSKGRWFIVRSDRRANVLRVSVAYKGEAGKYPTRQLVYSFDYKSWWEERYPTSLVGATDTRTKSGGMALIYGATTGKCFRLNDGLVDYAQGAISSVKIENPGYGYTKPPKITAREHSGTEYSGAEFTCSLDTDGRITGVQIRQCGTGYKAGYLTIDPPPQGGEQAVVSCTVHSGEMPVHYSVRTGNMEFTSDAQDRRAGQEQPRQVSMVYQPTQESSVIRLETFYNGASYPRSNTVRRDRGVGFVHSDTEPAATLDMQATPIQAAESHGVARALFAGRTLDDMDGADRHVAIGLSGTQDTAGRVVIHSLDVYGVNAAEK